jgi:hypothetical protein
MKHDIHVLQPPGQFVPVPNIPQGEMGMTMLLEPLLQKKQLALIVIQPHQFRHLELLQELSNQFPAHSAASPGDQDPFVFEK